MKSIIAILFFTASAFVHAESINYCNSLGQNKPVLAGASVYAGPLEDGAAIVPDDEKNDQKKRVTIYENLKNYVPRFMYLACMYGDIKHPEIHSEKVDRNVNKCFVTHIHKTKKVVVSCEK